MNSSIEIKKVEHTKSITGSDPIINSGLPQVAFVGRSNVGKSSVINCLVNRKNLARSSSKPGKTQRIHFYTVNDALMLVDLPGYGYAKISAKEAQKIRSHIIWYLSREEGKRAKGVVLVIDASVGITDHDRDLLEIIYNEGYPLVIAANKIDKLNQSETHQAKVSIEESLQKMGIPLDTYIPFSAKTGRGREQMRNLIFSL